MRRAVSLVLTVSFAATAITGLLMMFARIHMLTPVHEIMSLALVISALFHVVLNASTIGKYIKERPILAGSVMVLTIIVTVLIMMNTPQRPGENGHNGPPVADERSHA